MALNSRQANVMSHALAYPKMNRNRFRATRGSQNADTWRSLVALGFAVAVQPSYRPEYRVEDYDHFAVTPDGVAALIEYEQARVKQQLDAFEASLECALDELNEGTE